MTGLELQTRFFITAAKMRHMMDLIVRPKQLNNYLGIFAKYLISPTR